MESDCSSISFCLASVSIFSDGSEQVVRMQMSGSRGCDSASTDCGKKRTF